MCQTGNLVGIDRWLQHYVSKKESDGVLECMRGEISLGNQL